MQKILVIDDDPDFHYVIKSVLDDSYLVLCSENGEHGMQLAFSHNPDLILVDLLMPGLDGVEVSRRLKQDERTGATPIIILTVNQDDDRRSEALWAGADDLMAKPIRPKELLARIALRMNGRTQDSEEVVRCGNLVLDIAKFEARIAGKSVPLTVLEFKLLRLFVQNRERLLSRDRILDAIWDREVTGRVVDNHILSLRKKLTDATYYITSVYGAGYILKPRQE